MAQMLPATPTCNTLPLLSCDALSQRPRRTPTCSSKRSFGRSTASVYSWPSGMSSPSPLVGRSRSYPAMCGCGAKDRRLRCQNDEPRNDPRQRQPQMLLHNRHPSSQQQLPSYLPATNRKTYTHNTNTHKRERDKVVVKYTSSFKSNDWLREPSVAREREREHSSQRRG